MATVAVTTSAGAEDATAFYVRRGLAVTRTRSSGRWRVTHVASGMALDTGFRQRQRAKHYQDALLHMDIDWTQDARSLMALPHIEQRLRALHGSCPH
jgi:hypothetical protein